MATLVQHGPTPKFGVPLARGRYSALIEGRYTKVPGVTAAGVKRVRWNSDRAAKQHAEMLGMRTAFVTWFLETWVALGGSYAHGARAFTAYPYRRLQRQLRIQRRRAKA